MEMPWHLIAYWICFGLGFTYATVSALLTGFFGLVHHAGDVGGGHAEMGDTYGGVQDGVGHGEAFATAEGAEPAISPISPATIAMFMTVFGGVGVLLTVLAKMELYTSLPIAFAAGVAAAAFIFLLFYHFFTKVQASSETRMAEVIGLTAEVTVPIAHAGVGEVAYVCRGARLVSPARAEGEVSLGRHAVVRITRQVGNTLYVAPRGPEEGASPGPSANELDAKD
jgi:membrane protein implicated in regulation of membrane protease activity